MGSKVRDRFDRQSPVGTIVALTERRSVSPEGYRVWRVREPDGKEYDASEYDLISVPQ